MKKVRKLYAIETVSLTKRYPKVRGIADMLMNPFEKKEITALENVSIKIKEGGLFGILGPNGAGKTTLIKLLCTLILPNSGEAYVNGYDIVKDSDKVKASLGMVTCEERSFYWRLTGRQNLEFWASLHNFSSPHAKKRIEEVLRLVDLYDRADDRFHSYSAGMRQRIAIARGLLNDPKVLFMDEPTKGLDPNIAQKIREFISEKLVKEQGKTVFLATHNMREAEELCNKITIINNGKIKAHGALRELQKKAAPELILIEVKNCSARILGKIGDLKRVITSDSSAKSSITTLEIEVSNSKETLPEVSEIIVRGGGKIVSCNIKLKDLDDIFAQITGGRG